MRNLKRVLSLALAAMMLIGMMVVGASAASYDDFTDKDEIVNTEAVQVLNALGVIDGKEDGSFFDPTGNVTRAEMAKMITIISLGNVDVSAFLGTTTDLTDISGNWAEAYIKYCYSQGVIAGRGDGTFDPTANVTAAEAAKMLLVAIGYNSKVQVYEGNNWAINVTRDAQLSGFFDDLSVTSTKPLTRDEAAQMIYNAVDATMIEKTSTVDREDGSISDHYAPYGDERDLLEVTFEVRVSEGVMEDFDYDSDKSEWNYDVNVVDGDALDAKGLPSAADYTNLFQMNVKALWTVNKAGDVIVYGIFAEDSTVMATGVLGDLGLDDLASNKVKVGSTTYRTTNNTLTYYAFGSTVANAIAAGTNFDHATNTLVGDSYSMKLIDNTGDGKADVVVYLPYTMAKVNYVGQSNITTNAPAYSSLKLEDIVCYDGIAKDDYVIITDEANSVTEQDEVAKADMISGKVVKTSGSKVMIGDTYYNLVNGVTATLGSEYDGVVVNGYLVGTEVTKSDISVSDYAVVVAAEAGAGALNSHAQAKLLLANGETVIVDVDANYTGLVGKLVTFEVDDDVYTLTAAGTDTTESNPTYCGFKYAVTNANYSYSSVKGYGTIAGNEIADDAVIFYHNTTKDTWSIITGAELKKTTTGIAAGAVANAYGSKNASTGLTAVEMACVAGTTASESDAIYGYLLGDPVAVKDDDKNTVYELTVWTADGQVTLTTKNNTTANTAAAAMKKGTAFSYKLTDELVSDITTGTVAAVTAFNGTDITFATGNVNTTAGTVDNTTTVASYINDDTVILYVDRDGLVGVEGGSVQLAIEHTAANTYYANVSYILSGTADADGNYPVNVLVVEIANNWFNADII